MKPAIIAPAIAIPIPTPTVDARSESGPVENARIAMERLSNRIAAISTGSLPKRRASQGVGRANSPINTSGIDVSNEAAA